MSGPSVRTTPLCHPGPALPRAAFWAFPVGSSTRFLVDDVGKPAKQPIIDYGVDFIWVVYSWNEGQKQVNSLINLDQVQTVLTV